MDTKQQIPRSEQVRLEKITFLMTLVLVSVLFLLLLLPFWGAIFWACIIGLIFSPMYQYLLRIGKPKPNLAALAALFICFVIGIIPSLFVIISFFREGSSLYNRLKSGEFDIADRIDKVQTAFPIIKNFFDRFDLDINSIQTQFSDFALTFSGYIAQNALALGQGTLQFFIALGLMLYMTFFMLRDGDKLVEMLVRALPLGNEREYLLFHKFAEVVRATVKGNLLVAAVQGILGGIIFWVLDIPGAFLWGVVMALLSLIPVIGAGLIWGPVAIYLFAVGEWSHGVILVAFGAGVIGLADNILRPLLVGRDTKLPDYIVLLSTLGGFSLFGMNGFVLGPLVAALFIAFWEIFIREFNTSKSNVSNENSE